MTDKTKIEREANGRFKAGNPGGPGNPYLRRVAAHRKAVRECVTVDHVKAMIGHLYRLAMEENDVAAAKVWLERVLGKAREEPARFDVELPALTDAESVVEASRRVLEGMAAGAVDPAAVPVVLAMLRDFRESVLLDEMLGRIAELEAGTGDTARFHAARTPERFAN